MKKTLTIISSAVLALAIAIPGIAGSQLAKKVTKAPEKASITLKAGQKKSESKKLLGAQPRKTKSTSGLRHSKSNLNLPLKMRTAAPAKAMLEELNIPTIYGSVIFNDYQVPAGLYNVSSPATEVLFQGPDATYGGVCVDGIYYTVNYVDLGFFAWTEGYAYDVETGEEVGSFDTDYDALSVGYTLDPTTGDVYGINYTADLAGMQLVKADFTLDGVTINSIAELSGKWNTLVCDKNGQLYAISYTGSASYLNKIDKATGEVTMIGETGQLPNYLSSACIDPKSNRMFWNVCAVDETGVLCEVNLETGAATQLFQYEANDEICGMYIPYLAEDNAPATVTNLAANFPEGSMSGTVSFDAPTTLFDGTEATGELAYSILANGVEVKSGTTSYGASVSEALTFEESGDYTFTVTVSNDKGSSPKAKVTVFVGKGTPEAPNASLTYTDGVFNLTWDAITTSVDGGYLNPEAVTYTVTRYPGAEVVAAAITETSFSEEIAAPTELTEFYYTVVADADGMTSAVAKSNVIVLGSIEPPYDNTFDSEDSLAGYTIIDNNEDGRIWSWINGSVRMTYNGYTDMDDYLITPPMKLVAGNIYYISFRAWNNSTSYTERVEAKIGMQPTAEGLDKVIVEPTIITGGEEAAQDLGSYFIPEVSGVYYLGIHGISNADQYYLYVDDISISAPMAGTVPNEVTNIEITPDQTGALKATVEFKAPVLDAVNGELKSITKIEVSRGGEVVKTFENPAVGEFLSFEDTLEEGGNVTYTFQAFNEDGAGMTASATAFVGNDVPEAPVDLTITEEGNTGNVTITWAPVTKDIQGKPLADGSVFYVVTDESGNALSDLLTDTTYTIKEAVPAGEQDFVQYAVFALTNEGQAYNFTDMIAVGTPYDGMKESFPDGSLNYILGLYNPDPSQPAEVKIYDDNTFGDLTSYEGDNGMLGFYGQYLDYTAAIFTGKISLEGAANPGISFYTYNISDQDINEIQLAVKEPADEDWTPLGEPIVVCELTDEEGWALATASLEAYAGKTVQVSMQATVKAYQFTFIDNIKIGNLAAQDLSVSAINAPEKVTAGDSYKVDVTVANEGMQESTTDATVELYADGELAESKALEALAPGARATVSFERAFGPVETTPVVYYAKVVYAADEDLDNNTSENIAVSPKFSNLPKVDDLAAVNTDGGVQLTWSEPDLSNVGETKFVDFEDATAWDFEFEGWTFIDRDNSPVGGFQGSDIPGITPGETTASFFVFDAEALFPGNPTFEAHSGNIYIASIFRYDDGQIDDWAISPELDGSAQTISFWAKSYSSNYPEDIEMLYSTGSTNPDDFVMVSKKTGLPDEWTEYTFDVPEGAKYFAIRSCATGSFMLMLDDFTFSAASVSANLSIVGYDVYRDGVKITEEPTAETEYVDTEATDGNHSYVVVVVYDRGTSAPSNVVTVETSGVKALNGALAVKAGKGNIAVSGADGMLVTIAAADGKVVYNGVAAGKVSVDVPAGVYVVKADKKTTKVAVK